MRRADDPSASRSGFLDDPSLRSRAESLGERLLGSLLDRAHILPPRLVAPLVAQELEAVGGRDVSIYLQDYEQEMLVSLPGERLLAGEALGIDNSIAGRAFAADSAVEHPQADGSVRLYLPLLDGSDRIGILALTLDRIDDDDRRLARRLGGLVADMLVTKGLYTDAFFNARRTHPMTLSAQMQWQLLPPLTMTTPRVALAGVLEPAYEVGGDSFDYALNEQTLHLAIVDAMGHGLDAATMATVAVAAYRHARRAGVGLDGLYRQMDAAMATQFGPERFATAQMAELDVVSGRLNWVNAGHPAPLLLRGRRMVRELTGPTTLPVGFGGDDPQVQSVQLEPDDRVLFFSDGVIEERLAGGEQFGDARLQDLLERAGAEGGTVQETVRRLSAALLRARADRTSDDATLLLVQWNGAAEEDELSTSALQDGVPGQRAEDRGAARSAEDAEPVGQSGD